MSALTWLLWRFWWWIVDVFSGVPLDAFDVDKRLAIRAAKVLTRHRAPKPDQPPIAAGVGVVWLAPSTLGKERADWLLRHGLRGPKGTRAPYTPNLVPHILRALIRERDDEVKENARQASLVDEQAELKKRWELALVERDQDHHNAEQLRTKASREHATKLEEIARTERANRERSDAERDAVEAARRAERERCSLCQGGVTCSEHGGTGARRAV
jgi:hypothetical protein